MASTKHLAPRISGTGNTNTPRHFPGTDFSVQGRFLDYWRAHGLGLADAAISDREVLVLLCYAIEPAETAGLVDAQPFRRATFDNLIVATNTPSGRVVYALYANYLGSSACIPSPALGRPGYERFPLARP